MDQITQIAIEKGLGVASFVGLIYVGWKIILFIDKVAAMGVKFMENHAAHYQGLLEELALNSRAATKIAEDTNKKLDAQSQMLGLLVQNTKK